MSSIFLLLASLVLLVAATLMLVLFLLHKSGEEIVPMQTVFGSPAPMVWGLIAALGGLLTAIAAFYLSSRTQTLAWRLENFSEYKAQVEKQWGQIT